jgi:hypothetical protein
MVYSIKGYDKIEVIGLIILMNVLFILNLSLLMLHEMDAIRNKEWTMFAFLKDMEENRAYWVFTLVHLPLYALFFCGLIFDGWQTPVSYGLDLFLIFHTIIHYVFRNKPNNHFSSRFSWLLISTMGVFSVAHILFGIIK